MRFRAVVVAGLLPLATVGAASDCSMDAVLDYFTAGPVAEGCLDSLAEQAAAWCLDYMSIDPVTVPASTETPVTTKIVTETSTTSTTTTEVIFTTLSTTTVTNITIFDERTETATVTARPPDKKRFASKFVARDAPSCDNLIKKNLHRQPAWKLASACSCLNPQPVTVTAGTSTAPTSTTTTTETVLATEIESETSVSTDVVTVTSTREHSLTLTTTVTVTPTPTPTCSVGYRTNSAFGVGNNVEYTDGTIMSTQECCELCHTRQSCVGMAFFGHGLCQLLIKVDPLEGAPTSAQCPLGIDDAYVLSDEAPNGHLMKGPCMAA